jgi:ribose-phosphate pyrophosphokinase
MTTLALTDPPLKRLFERLDFSPRPRPPALAAIMEYWQAKRQAAVCPAMGDIVLADLATRQAEAFLFRVRADGRDFVLMTAGRELATLLGSIEAGKALGGAPRRRFAARLRRLFRAVRSAAEPILAEFGGAEDPSRWSPRRSRPTAARSTESWEAS